MPTKYGLAKQRAFDKEKAMTQPTTPANDDLKERAIEYIDGHGHLMMWDLVASFATLISNERVAAERARIAAIIETWENDHDDYRELSVVMAQLQEAK